jgi:hypothetical protein
MFYLLFASSSQLTIGSIDAMDFGAETCGLPPDFRPLRKARQGRAALYDRSKQPLRLRKRVYCVRNMRARRSGAYAPPLPKFRTGLMLLIVVVAIVVAALLVRSNLPRASRKHGRLNIIVAGEATGSERRARYVARGSPMSASLFKEAMA